jgi:hypothetical protein
MSDTAYISEKDRTNTGRIDTDSATPTSAVLPDIRPAKGRPSGVSKDVEGAVYSYIKAVRALGRTRVSASEIAGALSLPTRTVLLALDKLQEKGIKKPAK